MARMPTGQPRSVVDIPEDIWNTAVNTWRAGHEQQARAEALDAQAGQAALKATADAIHKRNRELAAGAAQVRRVVVNSRPVKVGLALFGDKPQTKAPSQDPVDYRVIDQRIDEIEGRSRAAIEAGRLSGDPDVTSGMVVGNALKWMWDVRPGGRWDDKDVAKRLGDPNYQRFERQGNVSYGATAAALGLPENVALRGAGLVHRGSNAVRVALGGELAPGSGWFTAPYGDDPNDQGQISEGYPYTRRRMERRGR